MGKFAVNGGNTLLGEININGAKNAALPILCASVLTSEETVLKNIPSLSDTKTTIEILQKLGCKVKQEEKTVIIDSCVSSFKIQPDLACKMRSSVIFLGSLLSRTGEAWIPYPGGCCLGSRPIDLHLFALKKLGAEITEEDGIIKAKCKKLKGCNIKFDFPSVGATQNAILAAVLAEGETVLENAASEPEIVDLCLFLNSMGAKINGIGSSRIIINGVRELKGCEYSIIPDRIEAGTYMCCCAAAGGKLTLNNAVPAHNAALITALQKIGCSIKFNTNKVIISREKTLMPIDFIETLPYPAFPTDIQPQLCAVLATASGKSHIKENIFEQRNKYAFELNKMGANIKVINGNEFVVKGVASLNAAEVNAPDLRGGAALITAALSCKGRTIINGSEFVLRGYESIEKVLTEVGGDVSLIE